MTGLVIVMIIVFVLFAVWNWVRDVSQDIVAINNNQHCDRVDARREKLRAMRWNNTPIRLAIGQW